MNELTVAEIEAVLFAANQGVIAVGSVQIGRMGKLADFESGFAKLQAHAKTLVDPPSPAPNGHDRTPDPFTAMSGAETEAAQAVADAAGVND